MAEDFPRFLQKFIQEIYSVYNDVEKGHTKLASYDFAGFEDIFTKTEENRLKQALKALNDAHGDLYTALEKLSLIERAVTKRWG